MSKEYTLDEFIERLEDMEDIIHPFLDASFIEAGEIMNGESMTEHPSWENRIGELQLDINYKYDSKKMILQHGLGFNPMAKVESKYGVFGYGVFQHEGTEFIPGNQWIYKGYDNRERDIFKEIGDGIQKGLEAL